MNKVKKKSFAISDHLKVLVLGVTISATALSHASTLDMQGPSPYITSPQLNSEIKSPSVADFKADPSCKKMEEQRAKASENRQKEISESQTMKDTEKKLDEEFNCQMTIAGELTGWVKGATGFGVVDNMLTKMSEKVSKKMCDQVKQRVNSATRDVQKIADMIGKIPDSVEDLEKLADKAIEKGAKELEREIDKKVDSAINEAVKEIPKVPSISPPEVLKDINKATNDPWGAIRNAYSGN